MAQQSQHKIVIEKYMVVKVERVVFTLERIDFGHTLMRLLKPFTQGKPRLCPASIPLFSIPQTPIRNGKHRRRYGQSLNSDTILRLLLLHLVVR